MNKWKCPRCGEWFDSAVVAVDKNSRKNKRGRIAWLRDGICPKCAAKKGVRDMTKEEKREKERKRAAEFRSKHPEYHAIWQRENKEHVNAYKRERYRQKKQEAAP